MQAPVQPAARIASESHPGSVLSRKSADTGDVRTRPAFLSRFLAWPEEHAGRTAAITHGGLRDDDWDRYEPPRVLEKLADVELTVIGIKEPRPGAAAGIGRVRTLFGPVCGI